MNLKELEFQHVNLAAYNPRQELQPGDPEWTDIEASLEQFGQVVNLVWNQRTGNVVGGHQRIRVMRHKGRDRAFFAVVDLSPEDEKRLNLILNKVTGRWDSGKLANLVGELKLAKLDVDRLGFRPMELNRILGTTPRQTRRDPDATAPDRPAIAITQPGDLWELTGATGNTHRLMCGDVRAMPAVERLMNGQQVRLIFTDPPYRVAYDNSTRGDGRRPLGEIENDNLSPEEFQKLLVAAFTAAHAFSIPEAALYTFLASATHIDFETALNTAGWKVKQQIVWAKHFALSRSDYHWAHEPILYAAKAGQNCQWFGPRTETTLWATGPTEMAKLSKPELLGLLLQVRDTATIWHEPRDHGASYVHPTQKPVGLAKKALLNSTLPGDGVADFFGGSGSTLVATELLDRVSFTLELSPRNCDVIARRFVETFEGATASRNGEPWTPRS